jgi:hypothetical protein
MALQNDWTYMAKSVKFDKRFQMGIGVIFIAIMAMLAVAGSSLYFKVGVAALFGGSLFSFVGKHLILCARYLRGLLVGEFPNRSAGTPRRLDFLGRWW